MISVEELLKNLITIPSVSGGEIKVGDYLFNLLKEQNFQVKKQFVDQNRFNLVANFGNPKIYFSAHMDTVAPFFGFNEDTDYIYGRGSCDTKSSIASMIIAIIKAKDSGFNDFGLIFTVGEETNFDGIKSLIKSDINIPFVIVGEPTSCNLVNGHYGILNIKLTSQGKSAHTSQPQKGINAIDLLIDAIRKIKSVSIHPETPISLVKIEGGTADNIVPQNATAIFGLRPSPNDSNNYYDLFKSKLNQENDTKIEVLIDVSPVHFTVPKELSFIGEGQTVKYFTELSFCPNGVVLGPGDIKFAHGLDERILKSELSKAVDIYYQILKNYSSK
ncbi:MAG: M20/M25/M40 family metallo-hydrolase [Candidatus Shapirobacteria bacterium]|nr:M20/M25/M40 family metallo-hydrolase [Candidatus Shapirobacteria bacterium]